MSSDEVAKDIILEENNTSVLDIHSVVDDDSVSGKVIAPDTPSSSEDMQGVAKQEVTLEGERDMEVAPFSGDSTEKTVPAGPKRTQSEGLTAAQLRSIEVAKNTSLDYYETGNNIYALRQMKYAKETRRLDQCCTWMMVVLIGIAVGAVGIAMRLANTNLSKYKFNLLYDHLADNDHWIGYVLFTAISLSFNILSAVIILFFNTHTGSGGVAELKAYLNGSNIPDVFSVETLCLKVVSSVSSVLSAFPCGLQGPMIHIGSIIGVWMSTMMKKTVKRILCCARVDEEIRDDEDILVYPHAVPSFVQRKEYNMIVHSVLASNPTSSTFHEHAPTITQVNSVTIDGDIVPVTSLGKSVLYTAGLNEVAPSPDTNVAHKHGFRKPAVGRKLNIMHVPKELQNSLEMTSLNNEDVVNVSPSPKMSRQHSVVLTEDVDIPQDTKKRSYLCPRWVRSWQLPSFNSDMARRDFQAMGGAAGMAASMGAPIGGVQLVLEELGSHWTNSLALKLLACSVFASVTAAFFGTAANSDRIGEFLPDFYSTFFVGRRSASYRIEEIPAFLLVGVIVAVCTSLHVKLQFWLLGWKKRLFAGKKWLHLLVTVQFAILWCAISVSIIFIYDCVPTSEQYYLAHQYSNGGGKDTFLGLQANCPKGYHSPMAGLSIARYDVTVKRLLSRGQPEQFPIPVLLLWLFLTVTLFNLPAFVAMTPGVILPFLIIGATIGRQCGKILYELGGSRNMENNTATGPNIFFDPGVYAALGTSAVFASATQSTLSMSIAVMEITADLNLLLPILLGSIAAHIASSPFVQPYYMGLINLRGQPFLSSKPPRELNYMTAGMIMKANPIILGSLEKVGHQLDILESCQHNGFGVVVQPCTAEGCKIENQSTACLAHIGHTHTNKTYVGLIIRRTLLTILNRRVWKSNSKPFTPEDYDRVMSREPPQPAELRAYLSTNDLDQFVDLVPWADSSAFTVHENMTAAQVYKLFRSMNLRHLPVCDMKMNITGMITRFELLTPVLIDKYNALLQKEEIRIQNGGPTLISEWCTRNTALEHIRRYQLIQKHE